jgi:hypothetical protein
MFAPMAGKIALPIAIDIEAPNRAPACDGFFPNTCVNRLVLPLHMARKPHINRD